MATMKYPRLENQNREPILATLEYERRTNEERKKNTELIRTLVVLLFNLTSELVLSMAYYIIIILYYYVCMFVL